MTSIGVIGAGHIGRSFSLAAIATGHEIVIANDSGPETLGELAAELGPKARAATTADAAGSGDVQARLPTSKLVRAFNHLDPDVDQPTFVVRQNAEELRANLAKAARHAS